ncbi:MAG: T9SS type A sorting domain-containing protein [Saprospiraceae bacterium]|nr:T9SS type A sorting domain-containing protein [Saprospiraceae bacterium]
MKKSSSLIICHLFLGFTIFGQVNFSEDIAPIIYENCTSCHRPGEIAPFSLTNYEQVAAWGATIRYVTEIQYMPPWKPDRTYSKFVGEKGLTEAEIQLIADWVDAGTPQGDPALAPPLPNFPSGSQLGTPDLVLEMAEDYFIEGNNQDDYRVFVLPTGLTEDREIAAIEFRPGNTRAVHHALIAYDTNGEAAAMDALSPEYGYESFGDFGVPIQGTFTGYTPGIQSLFFPVGIGKTLPAGADLIIQVHYAPLATNETDRSSLNIFFKAEDDPISREVQNMPITPLDLDGGFFSFSIPPNEIKTFHGTKEIEEDISFISVYPHSHYLGKNWELFAVTPQSDTINIIRINEWDFNWQGSYTFDRMKKIPGGSIIHINASYDNTINNPFNPSNPPQTVAWGEGTTDEMYLVGTSYVRYREGDEDIVMGENQLTNTTDILYDKSNWLQAPYPNPSNGEVSINFYLDKSQNISLKLLDIKGQIVENILEGSVFSSGEHAALFNVRKLPAGVYTIQLSGPYMNLTKPLVVSE